jgi:hypothetical protein
MNDYHPKIFEMMHLNNNQNLQLHLSEFLLHSFVHKIMKSGYKSIVDLVDYCFQNEKLPIKKLSRTKIFQSKLKQ